MVRIKFLTDTGPIIHLAEINANELWDSFRLVIIPDIVRDELTQNDKPWIDVLNRKNIRLNKTDNNILLLAEKIACKYKLGKNDSIIIAHSIVLKTKYILTDDLELRKIAKMERIIPIGTLGILLRSLRKSFCNKQQVMNLIDKLLVDSSLYITENIVKDVKIAISRYTK